MIVDKYYFIPMLPLFLPFRTLFPEPSGTFRDAAFGVVTCGGDL